MIKKRTSKLNTFFYLVNNTILILFVLITLVGCRVTTPPDEEEQMEKVSKHLDSFDNLILHFYNNGDKNPMQVIQKTDSIISKIKLENDEFSWNKLGSLYPLRAELLYKNRQYRKSIDEITKHHIEVLNSSYMDETYFIILACNYVKLNQIDSAKNYLDSIRQYHNISDFLFGNYYEIIRNKDSAIIEYRKINHHNTQFYSLAQKRLEELKLSKLKYTNQLFYPSERKNFERINEQ